MQCENVAANNKVKKFKDMQKKLSLLFIMISLSMILTSITPFHNELKAQNDSYFNMMSTDREGTAGGINFDGFSLPAGNGVNFGGFNTPAGNGINFGNYIDDYSNGGVSFNDFGYGGEAYVPLGNALLLLSGAGISYALYKRKRNNNK